VFWFRLICFVLVLFGLFSLTLGLVCLFWLHLICFVLVYLALFWFGFLSLVWLVRRLAGRLRWKFTDPLSDNEIHKTDSAALTSTLTPSTLKLCFMVSERGT